MRVNAARTAFTILLAVGVGLGATACTSDPNSVAEQAKAGDQKGYVSGDGTVEQIAVADRAEPVTLSGDTIDGSTYDLADVQDKVVVVNVWGSWCPPCVAEAADLQKVWLDVQAADKPVQFLGIDFREDPQRGQAFATSASITYPSLSDESGVQLLNLQGKASTTPTTLVLDKEHRIAARVSGAVTYYTLAGLIDAVLAQS